MTGKKKETTTVDQTETNRPLPIIESGLNTLIQGGQTALAEVPREPFPGPLAAGVDPLQLEARGIATDAARGAADLGTGASALGTDLIQQLLSGNFAELPQITPESTQGLQRALEALTRPTFERVQEQLLPQLTSQGVLQGAFTGARAQEVLPQLIARDASREIADAAARLSLGDVASQRETLPDLLQQILGATALGPQLEGQGFQQGLLPANILEQTGALGRADEQTKLDEILALFNEEILAPFRGLPEFGSLLGVGTPFGSSTLQGTTTKTSSGGLFGELLKAGLGVASAVGSGGFEGLFSGATGAGGSLTSGLAAGSPGFVPFNPGPVSVPKISFG